MSTDNKCASLFFQNAPCLSAHVSALRADAESYVKELRFLCESGAFVVVPSGARARILAALHIASQHRAASYLLKHCEVTDIFKAATLLDRPRRSRQLSQRIRRIEDEHPSLVCDEEDVTEDDNKSGGRKERKRARRIDAYRRQNKAILSELEELHVPDQNSACVDAHADTAVKELIASSSVSGAFARKVRDWAKSCLKSDFLEHVMLALPADPWRGLADLVHFSPGDFSVPYFLYEVHGGAKRSKKGNEDKGGGERDVVPTAPGEGSFVSRMRKLVKDFRGDDIDSEFFSLVGEFPQVHLMYSFIRTQRSLMSRPRIVDDLASRMPLDTSIWYFEELFEASPSCGGIISERLQASGDIVRSGNSKATYGKLVERILTIRGMRSEFDSHVEQMVSDLGFSRLQAAAALRRHQGNVESAAEWIFEDPGAVEAAVREESRREKQEGNKDKEEREEREGVVQGIANGIIPIAESRLDELKAYWKKGIHAKVAVFGDASESMQRAIEAATIFASMVSVCFDAELSFFSNKLVSSPHEKPGNVHETLQVCDQIRASGCTAPAAALWPYYEQRKPMDMFVLVTDEYENDPFNGHHFADLLAKYKTGVNDNVTLVLVCVGKGCSEFRQSLAKHNIDFRVVYIDESRPDLSKFDALIGQLAMVSSKHANSEATEQAGAHDMNIDNEGEAEPAKTAKADQEESKTDENNEDEFVIV